MADLETQTNVIAGLLHSEKLLYDGLTVLTSKHFADPFMRQAYEVITQLAEVSIPTWPIVYKQLRQHDGSDKLLAVKDVIAIESSFSYWLEQIHDHFIRRSYWEAAKEIQDIAKSNRPISEISELVEQKILLVNALDGAADQIITPEQAGSAAKAEFERRLNSKEKIHGIRLSREVKTGNSLPFTDGFPGIDYLLKGLKGGDLLIIAAETGEGKTTLAQNIVRHASIHQDYRTYYQNTEMEQNEVVFRFVAQMSGRSFESIYTGDVSSSYDQELIMDAFDKFTQSRVYISELPILTPERSRGLARQFKSKYGSLDLLVIDYVGRMELQSSHGKQEWQIMRDIAKNSKRLAQELDACVILIAQLNEEGKLQGAKAMANEADGMFFFGPIDKEDGEKSPTGATHKLTTPKVRRGAKNTTIWLSFNKPKMYITQVQ